MRLKLLILLIILIAGAGGWLYFKNNTTITPSTPNTTATNFEDCVAQGNPVMESYPRRCASGDRTFTEDIGTELVKADLIKVDLPRPNTKITSPFRVAGQARGTWLFEATAPVYLYDANGHELTQSFVQAQEEWMTEEFVDFEGKLIFETPTTATGTVVFKKSNPSGLPENDDELIIPVKFQ